VPLLHAALVDELITRGMQGHGTSRDTAAHLLLARSWEGTGTNALFQRPLGVMPFLFGPNSLQQHQQAARARGVSVEVFFAQ
jgi:2-phospho-L-lactate guanylyltransferase (CobY/MobA/RfbA family)